MAHIYTIGAVAGNPCTDKAATMTSNPATATATDTMFTGAGPTTATTTTTNTTTITAATPSLLPHQHGEDDSPFLLRLKNDALTVELVQARIVMEQQATELDSLRQQLRQGKEQEQQHCPPQPRPQPHSQPHPHPQQPPLDWSDPVNDKAVSSPTTTTTCSVVVAMVDSTLPPLLLSDQDVVSTSSSSEPTAACSIVFVVGDLVEEEEEEHPTVIPARLTTGLRTLPSPPGTGSRGRDRPWTPASPSSSSSSSSSSSPSSSSSSSPFLSKEDPPPSEEITFCGSEWRVATRRVSSITLPPSISRPEDDDNDNDNDSNYLKEEEPEGGYATALVQDDDSEVIMLPLNDVYVYTSGDDDDYDHESRPRSPVHTPENRATVLRTCRTAKATTTTTTTTTTIKSHPTAATATATPVGAAPPRRKRLIRRGTPLPSTPEHRWPESEEGTRTSSSSSSSSSSSNTGSDSAPGMARSSSLMSQLQSNNHDTQDIVVVLNKVQELQDVPEESTRVDLSIRRPTVDDEDDDATRAQSETTTNAPNSPRVSRVDTTTAGTMATRHSKGGTGAVHKRSLTTRPPTTRATPRDAPGVVSVKRTESHLPYVATTVAATSCAATNNNHNKKKKMMIPVQTSVRGLPRDRSIEQHHSSDSDISIHPTPPISTEFSQTSEVENRPLRDASNQERGLYTGSMDRTTHLPDGFGTMKYQRQGREYTGDWDQGHYHGHGKHTNANGDVYDGPFVRGQKEGPSADMTFRDGRLFHGRYHSDKMREGHLQFTDGSYYEGLLEKDERNGFGLYHFKNGDHYEGQWKNDLMHGRGRMEWYSDGAWYNGDWEYAIQHGMGTEVHPNGTIKYQGHFHQGKPIHDVAHAVDYHPDEAAT